MFLVHYKHYRLEVNLKQNKSRGDKTFNRRQEVRLNILYPTECFSRIDSHIVIVKEQQLKYFLFHYKHYQMQVNPEQEK